MVSTQRIQASINLSRRETSRERYPQRLMLDRRWGSLSASPPFSLSCIPFNPRLVRSPGGKALSSIFLFCPLAQTRIAPNYVSETSPPPLSPYRLTIVVGQPFGTNRFLTRFLEAVTLTPTVVELTINIVIKVMWNICTAVSP